MPRFFSMRDGENASCCGWASTCFCIHFGGHLLLFLTHDGGSFNSCKTRGHADKYIRQADVSAAAHNAVLGNQVADNAATAGQRGQRKGVVNLEQYLQQHLH